MTACRRRASRCSRCKDGSFKRVYPKKQASFDCKTSNRVTLKLNLITN